MKTKAKSGGWTNLLSHLRSCVGKDYEQLFAELEKLKASKEGGGYFVRISDRKKEMFKWIEFVVMKNLPVSFVDCCPYTRDITQLKNISAQMLRFHTLELLSVGMKETVQAELPPKFIIVFDGWTEGTHHYIRADGTKEVPVQTIFSMKPLLVDSIKGMQATDHLDHEEKVLESYANTLKNILSCQRQLLSKPEHGSHSRCTSHRVCKP